MENKDLHQMHKQQTENFALAGRNFKALGKSIYREITFQDFNILLQYNPARIISTNAKTDKVSLERRPCFLCRGNMPEEQQGIPYHDKYHIFINPYPIFKEHFTVPADIHVPQLIRHRFEDLLNLSHDFNAYTIFYNGPSSGASAPDHFHFQIVPQGIMPLEKDVYNMNLRDAIIENESYKIATLKNYLRKVFIIESADYDILNSLFYKMHSIFGDTVDYEYEPQMNILAWFTENRWTVCIFPRKSWRPKQFYLKGKEQIMFSPGCVDMAGLIISPRKEDFDRYNPELLKDLFSQVSVNNQEYNIIISKIQEICKYPTLK